MVSPDGEDLMIVGSVQAPFWQAQAFRKGPAPGKRPWSSPKACFSKLAM
jgi:hypothetical protein